MPAAHHDHIETIAHRFAPNRNRFSEGEIGGQNRRRFT
jgi:hypothetical protein